MRIVNYFPVIDLLHIFINCDILINCNNYFCRHWKIRNIGK